MKAFLIGLIVVLFAIGGTFFYREFYLKRKFRKLSEEKNKVVAPLILRVIREEAAESEILDLARHPSLRHALFIALGTCERLDLFPVRYLTVEKGAESSLVNWLEFPTELGAAPDEIEFVEKITLQDDGDVHYYAFRYRMVTKHWAKKFGWMIGVAGPYKNDHVPYDIPRKVFSRFNVAESISMKAEVDWVHANVNRS